MNLLSVFNNQTIQSTIQELNGKKLNHLCGFGMYSSFDIIFYYVIDSYNNSVYILNDEWNFISFKTFSSPRNMISNGNSLYVTGKYNVWKVDQNLNILINFNPGCYPDYEGISYNPSNGLIYVAAWYSKEIQVFKWDLTSIRRFSTELHRPYSIIESSNKLYVGTDEGIILVYQNEKIINQFNGCNGNSALLTSVIFDQNGYMATSCDNKRLYLYAANGSFTDKIIYTENWLGSPYYIGFDSKGRFIHISSQQIIIYNLKRNFN